MGPEVYCAVYDHRLTSLLAPILEKVQQLVNQKVHIRRLEKIPDKPGEELPRIVIINPDPARKDHRSWKRWIECIANHPDKTFYFFTPETAGYDLAASQMLPQPPNVKYIQWEIGNPIRTQVRHALGIALPF